MNAKRERRAMRSTVLLVTTALAGCGESSIGVTVELTASSLDVLNPFGPEVGLEAIQIVVDGPERGDDVTLSVGPDQTTAVVSDYPLETDETTLSIRAEGLDAQGNLVAFGRAPVVSTGDDVTIRFPFRRNLAYVTHRPNPDQRDPDSYLYVVDLGTRSLVAKLRIDGADPSGERVTARGGDDLLVTYQDGGIGYLGILSAEDHTWSRVELPVPQTLAVGVEGQPIGVVAGGGVVTFVNLDEAREVGRFPPPGGRLIGGFVLDGVISGDGRTALFVLGGVASGGVLFVDIEARTVEALDVVRQPAGVALAPDGRVAFVTSGTDAVIAEVDLRNGRVAQANGFARPVGLAAYSENMQAVLALDAALETRRVLALVPRANCTSDVSELCGQALPVSDATPTTERPVDLAADGVGRQIIVVGAGSSTAAAGLTLIETFAGVRELPIGARSPYPGDPDDTFRQGRNFIARQRYQPRSVAVIYGR